VIDNFTYIFGDHALKLGFSVQDVKDTRTATSSQLYTFSSVANYLAARSGANPFAYSTFAQYSATNLSSTRMTALRAGRLALPRMAALRLVTSGVPDAPQARGPVVARFERDGNNIQPRVGFGELTDDQRRWSAPTAD
jgi:hypothetical protein